MKATESTTVRNLREVLERIVLACDTQARVGDGIDPAALAEAKRVLEATDPNALPVSPVTQSATIERPWWNVVVPMVSAENAKHLARGISSMWNLEVEVWPVQTIEPAPMVKATPDATPDTSPKRTE